jgi:hypothetical protein
MSLPPPVKAEHCRSLADHIRPASAVPDLTLITPTGDRTQAFALCERWIRRQTAWLVVAQWFVVDDGARPTPVTHNQEHVRRLPEPGEGHTLVKNLRLALSLPIRGSKILFIEDDDWYGPEYLATMSRLLDADPLVGEGNAHYYNLKTRQWAYMHNAGHASLCQTGVTLQAVAFFASILDQSKTPFVDMTLWQTWRGKRRIFTMPDDHPLSVGIKGMPGRAGIGSGHRPDFPGMEDAPDLARLRLWLGADADHYAPFTS